MLRAICAGILVTSSLSQTGTAQQPVFGTAPAPVPGATLGEPINQGSRDFRPSGSDNSAPAQTGLTVAAEPPTVAPPAPNFTGSYTTVPRPVSDAVSVNHAAEPQPVSVESLPRPFSRLFENMSLFVGASGFKEPLDLGINANFGYRIAFNWGLPIMEAAGLGIQVGTAVNYSENAMRILTFLDGQVEHWQYFTTVGVFQRTKGGLNWGVVYDFRFDDYYDRTFTGQWRAQLGMETNPNNEFGVWATIRDHGDSAVIGPFAFSVQPISQWNFYWRHIWANEIVTRLWIGLASEHSRFNVVIPSPSQINHPFTFGGDFYVPLSDNLALFGEAHFITPNDTGTVTATAGVVLYPGSARGTARSRFAPLLPVANNTTFALDVR